MASSAKWSEQPVLFVDAGDSVIFVNRSAGGELLLILNDELLADAPMDASVGGTAFTRLDHHLNPGGNHLDLLWIDRGASYPIEFGVYLNGVCIPGIRRGERGVTPTAGSIGHLHHQIQVAAGPDRVAECHHGLPGVLARQRA